MRPRNFVLPAEDVIQVLHRAGSFSILDSGRQSTNASDFFVYVQVRMARTRRFEAANQPSCPVSSQVSNRCPGRELCDCS